MSKMQRFAFALRPRRRPRVCSFVHRFDTPVCYSDSKCDQLLRLNRRSLHSTVSLFSPEIESKFQVPATKSIDEAGVVLHPDLKPYVRVSGCTDDHLANLDSGFTVTFLGTGASLSPFRSQTSTALRMGGKTFLFDAGDGVQRQLMFSSVNLGEIEKIFSKLKLFLQNTLPGFFISHYVDSYASPWRSRLWSSGSFTIFTSYSLSATNCRKDNSNIWSCWNTQFHSHDSKFKCGRTKASPG